MRCATSDPRLNQGCCKISSELVRAAILVIDFRSEVSSTCTPNARLAVRNAFDLRPNNVWWVALLLSMMMGPICSRVLHGQARRSSKTISPARLQETKIASAALRSEQCMRPLVRVGLKNEYLGCVNSRTNASGIIALSTPIRGGQLSAHSGTEDEAVLQLRLLEWPFGIQARANVSIFKQDRFECAPLSDSDLFLRFVCRSVLPVRIHTPRSCKRRDVVLAQVVCL